MKTNKRNQDDTSDSDDQDEDETVSDFLTAVDLKTSRHLKF